MNSSDNKSTQDSPEASGKVIEKSENVYFWIYEKVRESLLKLQIKPQKKDNAETLVTILSHGGCLYYEQNEEGALTIPEHLRKCEEKNVHNRFYFRRKPQDQPNTWTDTVTSYYAQKVGTTDKWLHNDYWILGLEKEKRDRNEHNHSIGDQVAVKKLFSMFMINKRFSLEEDSYCFCIPTYLQKEYQYKMSNPEQEEFIGSLTASILRIVNSFIQYHHKILSIEQPREAFKS